MFYVQNNLNKGICFNAYINGNYMQHFHGQSNGEQEGMYPIPVRKGDTIRTWNDGYSSSNNGEFWCWLYFYPLKD